MRLPIDTAAVQFVSAGPAEPVLDFETRAPKLDANGRAVFNVHLFVISPDSYDTLSVKVAGEPKGESRRECGRPLHFQDGVVARHSRNWRVVKM